MFDFLSIRAKIYLYQCYKVWQKFPFHTQSYFNLFGYKKWKKGLNPTWDLFANPQPWFSKPAIDFLHNKLRNDFRVFEWGSGYSTIYFQQHVAFVCAVEHDEAWAKQIVSHLNPDKTEYHVVLPEKKQLQPNEAQSSLENFAGFSFEKYSDTIEKFEDETFDIVVIDGRARPFCLKKAIPKLKQGGWIVYDNSQRTRYEEGIAYLKGKQWKSRMFFGPLCFYEGFEETTFLQKPSLATSNKGI